MKTIVSFLALLALIGCKKEQSTESDLNNTDKNPSEIKVEERSVEDSNSSTKDNSNNALDWEGIYTGELPCSDCKGEETVLSINKDLTYQKTTKHYGKHVDEVNVKGKFVWHSNGVNITLLGVEDDCNQYLVGENKLFQLDKKGNRISGNLASKYVLIKTGQK